MCSATLLEERPNRVKIVEEVPLIQKTNDYSIFKQVNFNREKNKKQVQNLKEIISQENRLHLHPILVNEKMEVIDGQHRLEAAMQLGVPVFYIKSDLGYDHILFSNLWQRKLALDDVIKYYARKDKIPSYIQVYDYLKTMDIKPKCFFGLVLGGMNRALSDHIKSGKFLMPEDEETTSKLIVAYIEFVRFAKSKRIKPYSMFTNASFAVALRNLVLCSSFDQKIFSGKLEYKWFDLKPQLDAEEWAKLLISIYNWKNHKPIEVDLTNIVNKDLD